TAAPPEAPKGGGPSSSQDTAASQPTAEPVYEVVSPLGESTAQMGEMARRLDTLNGKTVCMVWNYAFQSDVTLPAIGEALKKHYPDVKIVPYREMPLAPLPEVPGSPTNESENLKAALKAMD